MSSPASINNTRKIKVLAVIPARGGSKGIPKKNIQPLAGRPLINYTIDESKKSKYIDRIVVSTDDPEIAEISRSAGAEVVERPPELSGDAAATELALIHALETMRKSEGYTPDIVVTLEPTSPLRSFRLIDRCIEKFFETDADAVISVTETRECLGKIVDGRFDYLVKGQARRRQDREPLYRESSTVYATKTESLLRMKSVLGERLYAVVASEEEAIDINTPLDFLIAEAVMRSKKQDGTR